MSEIRRQALIGQSVASKAEIIRSIEPGPRDGCTLALSKTPTMAVKDKLYKVLGAWTDGLGAAHPWEGRSISYSAVPGGVAYHPTLDMAILAATVNGDSPPLLFCGEVDISGRFLALPYPLEVGRAAVERDLPVAVPKPSAHLVAMAGATVYPLEEVDDIRGVLRGRISPVEPTPWHPPPPAASPWDDLRYVIGQEHGKYALEVAVAGGHNLLVVGSPGEGKSELAKRAHTIAAPLDRYETLQVSSLWHGAGRLAPDTLMTRRPFVEAAKQTSPTGLLGGGDQTEGPRPGLVSLAHKGVLLADEFFEWSRSSAESLRIPLQDRQVVISRRDWQMTFPADFQLVATANPCPCGYEGHPEVACRCTEAQRQRYLAKISGPIFDRIDIKVRVPPLGDRIMDGEPEGENSATVRARVEAAAAMQSERYAQARIGRNAELRPGMYDEFCRESEQAQRMMRAARRDYQMSSRALCKLRSVCRTVADLEGAETVAPEHVHQALELVTSYGKGE